MKQSNQPTRKELARDLTRLLEERLDSEMIRTLKDIHPADAAEFIEVLDPHIQVRLLVILDPEIASEVLNEMPEKSREQAIQMLPVDRLSEMVDQMDSDDATDIVADLSEEDAQSVLESIDDEDSAEVRQLLEYPEDSAGGIMQLELIATRADETVADAIDDIREQQHEVQDITYVFVVDENNKLLGQVDLRNLVLARSNTRLAELAQPFDLVVKVEEDQEDVARGFQKYDVRSAPVVDEAGILLGRITVDDVLDVLQEEASEDISRMAGTSIEDELYLDKALKIVRLRLPWLLINLLGGLVSGYLVWVFKVTLKDVIILVSFIPAIMALGGSVGMQSSTIVVRGMALGKVRKGQTLKSIYREIRVALILGLICGGGLAVVARLWQDSSLVGLIVGLSMFLAITMASVLGAFTPNLFSWLKIDPALASGPFVTMVNDVVGIAIYMTVATVFLKFWA